MADGRFLEGRLAVVTGGARGIGGAIVDALADVGATVALLGRDAAALEGKVAALRDRGHAGAFGTPCDVSDEAAVKRAFSVVREKGGDDPYILVNNAGMGTGDGFTEMTLETWNLTLAVNLTGTFLCTREVLPAMIRARAGRVVNIASTGGLKGYDHASAYCAAKHGVVGLTRAVAMETAKRGVTVNAVCPGYTATEMAEQAVRNLVAAGRTEEDARRALARTMPLGRLIRPEEVAAAVLFLCSDAAGAITGQSLGVAGGEVM